MAKKLKWDELAPRTREARFSVIAANHLPHNRSVLPVMAAHSRCADGPRCTGPGCRFSR